MVQNQDHLGYNPLHELFLLFCTMDMKAMMEKKGMMAMMATKVMMEKGTYHMTRDMSGMN